MSKELKQIEECIKSLQWLKLNIVGNEEPKPHTFEYATKIYLENAINILKKYEKILNVIPQEIRSIDELQSMANWFYNNDYKKLKALEIIKKKEVNVFIFLHNGDLETYNDMVEDSRKLTQEEFDLLKEVLL